MSEMLEAALQYAARGWPIFPCRTDKTPYTKHGVADATTNKKKIEKWWTKHPHANIGLDVGGAGMMVLDLDQGHDKQLGRTVSIDEVWDGLEDALGDDLPDTQLRQTTPRGGEHLFFYKSRDEIIPPSASKIAPHVDVRSFNSYVLLPPSSTAAGDYEWAEQGKPAKRSNKMVELASKARERSDDHDTWIIEPDLGANIAAAIKYCQEEAQVAVEGRNGDHMAYATAAMMKSYGLSEATALEVMWEHWNPRCVPPWGPDEIDHMERKIENAYEYNTSPPGNMTEAYRVARAGALFKPVSRDDNSGAQVFTAGRFRAVDRDGIKNIKPPEWLIEGVIPQGAYAMLVGPRGTYKSFVAIDLALSIASGAASEWNDWEGNFPDVINQGPVLFAIGEGRSSFKQRIEAWEAYHTDGEKVEDVVLLDPVPMPTEDDVTAFINLAKSFHDYYELVVIDTVGRSMRGLNENTQQDAGIFNGMIERIQYELDCAVLAIHHTGHGNADRARGSSVFGADIDTEFVTERLESAKHLVRLKNTKQKDAPEWDQAMLIQLKEQDVADDQNSLVAVKPHKKLQQQEQQETEAKDGKKKTREKSAGMDLIRTVAYQVLKNFPNKEFTKIAMADAIAADERIELSSNHIRNAYLPELLADKSHPIARCWDQGKSKYILH